MQRFKHIIDQHRPAGYRLHRRKMKNHNGLTSFQRTITVDSSLDDRSALFIILHECAHVHFRHLARPKSRRKMVRPPWREEYDADQYAIKAMRSHSVSIPRATLADAKQVLREDIVKAQTVYGDDVDEEVLRYAFGRDWRKHR